MRFKEFKIGEKIFIEPIDINDVLSKNDMGWLIDSEIEDAEIEIKNKTLIWKNGVYHAGNWNYGIWKEGYFYGTWENGIWEKGTFKGKWVSGIK